MKPLKKADQHGHIDVQKHSAFELENDIVFYINLDANGSSRNEIIHRTTFLYRLDKITRRFKLDLSDLKRRLMCCLSIALLDQASHSST